VIQRLILPDILRLEVRQTPSFAVGGERVCITGGRDYEDKDTVFQRLNLHKSVFGIKEIGFGCATGADDHALEWAKEYEVSYKRYVADWDGIGVMAGCIRNTVMLEHFEPVRLFVFPGGTGTTDCARKARKRHIERIFIGDDSDPFAEATRWG
jgi:hypothetical protein